MARPDPTLHDEPLNAAERHQLLALARESLEHHLGTGHTPVAHPDAGGWSSRLAEARGAFVSLHVGRQLRGCIGSLLAKEPLYRLVPELAVAAASRDFRFQPLEVSEMAALHIEISVLGPPVAATDPDAIRIGFHGLVVEQGPRRGVLLPQVAVDQDWGVAEFLSHTCLKAGLPADAWRAWSAGRDREISVQTFTAQVFGEPADR